MRVVILYNTSWYVYLLRRNLIAKLQDAGFDITVVAPTDSYTDRIRQLNVDFIPITMSPTGKSPLRELETLSQIYVALRFLRPYAVLSFTVKCNLYAGLCRSRLSFRHVANVSGTGDLFDGDSLLERLAKRLHVKAFRYSQKVFFQNQDDERTFLTRGLARAEQSEVIPGSGVDLTHFQPAARSSRSWRSFLMFGRILPKKGFGRFLESAIDLKARYGESAQFWILGTPDRERAESRKLFEQIQRAHEQGIVRYIDPTDNVVPYIHEADAIALPSTYNEGVPRSLLEALACGKPIIATDWKGCRETVRHGKNGLLVRPNDTESLTRALQQMIECSDETLHEYGLQSRALAESRFDEQLVLDAYLRALRYEHDRPNSPTDETFSVTPTHGSSLNVPVT
jgi:glycosyltransferase involved in cell wall biosynthesis